jgi:hypothetical protein
MRKTGKCDVRGRDEIAPRATLEDGSLMFNCCDMRRSIASLSNRGR